MAKRPTGQKTVYSDGTLPTGLREACPCAKSEGKLGCRKENYRAHSVKKILPITSEIFLLKRGSLEARDLSKWGNFLGSSNLFESNSVSHANLRTGEIVWDSYALGGSRRYRVYANRHPPKMGRVKSKTRSSYYVKPRMWRSDSVRAWKQKW